MKKGLIVLDDWKLLVYRRRLEEAGIRYEDLGPFTSPDTTALNVWTEDVPALQHLLKQCEVECKKMRNQIP